MPKPSKITVAFAEPERTPRCTKCGRPIINFMVGYDFKREYPQFCDCKLPHHTNVPKGAAYVIKEHEYHGYAGKR